MYVYLLNMFLGLSCAEGQPSTGRALPEVLTSNKSQVLSPATPTHLPLISALDENHQHQPLLSSPLRLPNLLLNISSSI
ncbi:hypothetical protein F4818DRAFT_130974 [Hypoxylon cercidicola]|nr:hypothetical protein F4818DRAFT_130974 [Hypoxylon cercidicola]